MKVCKTCGRKGDSEYCPHCGNKMRIILIEQNSEIFVAAYTEDNIVGAGFHVGCDGIVESHKTSVEGVYAYSCRKCFLRILHNQYAGGTTRIKNEPRKETKESR